MKYSIGTFCKLKDYTLYSDYKRHDQQICVINKLISTVSPSVLKYAVRWFDGTISRVSETNLEVVKYTHFDMYLSARYYINRSFSDFLCIKTNRA